MPDMGMGSAIPWMRSGMRVAMMWTIWSGLTGCTMYHLPGHHMNASADIAMDVGEHRRAVTNVAPRLWLFGYPAPLYMESEDPDIVQVELRSDHRVDLHAVKPGTTRVRYGHSRERVRDLDDDQLTDTHREILERYDRGDRFERGRVFKVTVTPP